MTNGFQFLRGAAWFMAAIKNFGKHHGLAYEAANRIPHGVTFRVWTRCILLRADPAEFDRLDGIFRSRGLHMITNVSRDVHDVDDWRDAFQ